MTKTLNILILGSAGAGKAHYLVTLANKVEKPRYIYTEEKALTAISTVTSYELMDSETKTIITLIEVLRFHEPANTIKILQKFNKVFDIILLFIDGLGFENSKLIGLYQLETLIKSIKYDENELRIGVIVTKGNLIEKVNSGFIYQNILRILAFDLIPSTIHTYKGLGSDNLYTFKLSAYHDKHRDSTWFFLGHIEQLITTLMEKRVSILPPYDFFSKMILRYWIRNFLGSFIRKSMNLDNKKQHDFLLQLFKTFPTALEHSTIMHNIEEIDLSLWPHGIIEDIWNIPVCKEVLLQLAPESITDQIPTKKKLALFEDELNQIAMRYRSNYKTSVIASLESNMEEEMNRFYTFINEIIQKFSKEVVLNKELDTF